MKVRIVVSYQPRYVHGHRFDFVPPVTGIHLAALTGQEADVEVVHEQVRAVPIDREADLVALSFFAGFAGHAYAVADAYRALGVPVVAGGPHVSYWTEEALRHCDAVVVGEAESVWNEVLRDARRGQLSKIYRGQPRPLDGLPTPRYDLLEKRFVVRRVIQATRGCPFGCHFCSVPDLNPGFRVRPVRNVVQDITGSRFANPLQDKVVWFWDDNLLVNRTWAYDLLDAMRGLNKWWLTQASIDIVRDKTLMDGMERSGCAGIFLGIESLEDAALQSMGKSQNKVREYHDAIGQLHDRGICVMAGFISGFDDQTEEDIERTADRLNELGVDVPFLSILTPYRGTRLYDELLRDGRILTDRDWSHCNGYNVAFRPARMPPHALLAAHRRLWKRAFSPSLVAERLTRGARSLSAGGFMLSSAMNGFYGFKRVMGNVPATAALETYHPIAHPSPLEEPTRLSLDRLARVGMKIAD